jgi:hypothetical protein
MPDSIEYIVRPYQTPNVYGSIIIPSTPSSGRERATIIWGGSGTMPEVKESSDGVNFEVVCCQEQLDELDRTSERKRIFNNNDASSGDWVDVDRPLTMRLKKKEKNHCLPGPHLEETGVQQEISDAISDFADAIHSGTTSGGKNCGASWKFKNQ